MGYYIETPSHHNKAKYLIDNHRAERLSRPELFTGEFTTICVINNHGMFEAAGIMFDQDELDDFRPFDGRPKEWLKMPTEEVLKLNPAVGKVLQQTV